MVYGTDSDTVSHRTVEVLTLYGRCMAVDYTVVTYGLVDSPTRVPVKV
jgi:hypothetical protein